MTRATQSHSPLWLALRFPQVSLDLLKKTDPSQPLVIVDGNRVFQACASAQALGVQVGMSLHTALLLAQSHPPSYQPTNEQGHTHNARHTPANDGVDTSSSTQALLIRERCQQKELRHMQQLAQWAYQFTPYVSHWVEDCSLLLELGSCLQLFGGFPHLLQKIHQPLQQRDLHICTGLGHTPKAAWLLSWQANAQQWPSEWLEKHQRVITDFRSADSNQTPTPRHPPKEHGCQEAIDSGLDHHSQVSEQDSQSQISERMCKKSGGIESHTLPKRKAKETTAAPFKPIDIEQALNQLSLSQLPSFPPFTDKRQEQWRNIGLTTLGELRNLPRASIAKRYSKSCLAQLDQIYGTLEDLQTYILPQKEFIAERHYLSGLESVAMLEQPTLELLTEFQHFLRNQQLHSEGFHWRFFHFNKTHSSIAIELSAAHSQVDIFFKLTQLQLHQHQINSPIETIRLHSDRLLKAKLRSQALFNEHGTHNNDDAHTLIDTLVTRMGKNRLYQVQLLDDHLPECRQGLNPVTPSRLKPTHKVGEPIQPRELTKSAQEDSHLPLWLLPTPQRLNHFQRQAMSLLSSAYRIDSHWWQQRQQRDYFIAHDSQGHHWIYFDHQQKSWFLHGHYG